MSDTEILNIFQILIAMTLIGLVLMQAKGVGLGNIFGGGGGDTYRTRRGVERVLFRGTIVLIIVFAALSILAVRA